MIKLFPHQEEAIKKLRSGSILCGGVGSGKSLTALSYYDRFERSKKLYIITTAKKRDNKEWDVEVENFKDIWYVVDSWNNIKKYVDVEGCFFIFDEQKAIGSGQWSKSFIKIAKRNHWIILSATPGDNWMDYIPVFVANGFYRNRTEFLRRHVVFNPRTDFPKVERYLEENHLLALKKKITVIMNYNKFTVEHVFPVMCRYDRKNYYMTIKSRWNPYTDYPIQNASEFCYILRRIVNSDPSRLEEVKKILEKRKRVIVFYNFDYELDILRKLETVKIAEWNGHRHDEIPEGESWVYLVQYTAGAEGWNCVATDTIIFYSLSYSYKAMTQAAGRIDRLNTPYKDLYYYHIMSDSHVDLSIKDALNKKRDFNENRFYSQQKHILL